MTKTMDDLSPMPDGVTNGNPTPTPEMIRPVDRVLDQPKRSPEPIPGVRDIPQNLDAEMALLGSMMMDRKVIDEIAGMIPGRAAFYTPQHGVLYDALIKIHAGGGPMDLIVVSQWLTGAGQFELVGGRDYLMTLSESFSDTANAPHYARILVAHWQRRELITLAGVIKQSAFDALNDEPADECGRFQKELERIIQMRITNDVKRVDELFAGAMASLRTGAHGYVQCGIPSIDQRCGGLQRPGMVVLAGRPSTGKTTIAMSMLYAMARGGVPGMMISVETEQYQIALRTMCALTGETINDLKRVITDDEGHLKVNAAYRAAAGAPVYINDQPKTLRRIVSGIRAAVRQYKLGVVAVDYLQLIRAEGRWDSKNYEVTEICNTFANLKNELGVTLILLCQLNRDGANRDGHAPPTDDTLRDSGSIEQDADQIVMLYPADWSEWRRTNEPMLTIDMQKNRNGPLIDCTATFNKKSFRLAFGISEAMPTPAAPTPPPGPIQQTPWTTPAGKKIDADAQQNIPF